MIALDHIVYATLDFEKSLNDIEIATGVRPVIGGRHLNQGTKNALLNLGNQAYFEILAVDKTNTSNKGGRWMGIDLIQQDSATRLAFKSKDINAKAEILKKINPKYGQLIMGERQLPDQSFLRWEMTLPLARPAIDLIPFFINWGSGNHPCDKMKAMLKLEDLKLFDPNAKMLNEDFKRLGISERVNYNAQTSISGKITGPSGSFSF
jgi:hypothetical protein